MQEDDAGWPEGEERHVHAVGRDRVAETRAESRRDVSRRWETWCFWLVGKAHSGRKDLQGRHTPSLDRWQDVGVCGCGVGKGGLGAAGPCREQEAPCGRRPAE